MSHSSRSMTTSIEGPRTVDAGTVSLIQRFRERPLGPYDAELNAFLLRFRAVPAPGKHVLVRLRGRNAWTLGRLEGRGRPVSLLGGVFDDLASGEWAVFCARWNDLYGWHPERVL